MNLQFFQSDANIPRQKKRAHLDDADKRASAASKGSKCHHLFYICFCCSYLHLSIKQQLFFTSFKPKNFFVKFQKLYLGFSGFPTFSYRNRKKAYEQLDRNPCIVNVNIQSGSAAPVFTFHSHPLPEFLLQSALPILQLQLSST